VAVAQPATGRPPCALVLVGHSGLWTAETQATARTLVGLIAAQYRRASDIVELAEREEITRALVEASPDAVVIADATRHIVMFNAAAERLLGRPRSDAIGQDLRSVLIPVREHARFMASTELFLRTGEVGEFTGTMQLPVLIADGSELSVELTPLSVTAGDQTYFCCFLRDLGELAHAHAALAASQARFQLLSELAPLGIARTDRGGVCTFVNELWCVLGDGSAGEFTGAPWTQVLHPDDAGKVAQEWARARAAGAELRTDCRLRPNGGPQLWVHAAAAALPEDDDQPAGFLVALTNVSARKRAEEAGSRLLAAEQAARRSLADQTERLNSLIAAAIPGVLVIDENDVIVQLNQVYADLLGLQEPLDQLVGAHAERLMGRLEQTFADPADFMARMIKYRVARRRVVGEQLACADGRVIECDYWPVFVNRQYRGDLWLLWDVSERAAPEEQSERRLEAELAFRRVAEQARLRLSEGNDRLRELDEFRTRFLAAVSDDLRGPLSSIMSKIEAGGIPLELADTAIGDVVADAARAAAPAAAERGVALEQLVLGGPPARGDRLRLHQVVDALISNSVKFTGPGGRVTVTAAYRDNEWQIDVADSGLGIPADELGQIFDPFFRGSHARSAGVPGSGLGLAIVKAVTELHGGRLAVASTPGGGTTVSVYLPVPP
jgi:PAS domain S-box-containing protein